MSGESRGLRWVTAIVGVAAAMGLAAVSGVAGTSSPAGEPAPAAFRLEDGSAGCRLVDGDTLACRSQAAPTAVVLGSDGASRADEVEVAWDESTPVLLPAQSWWNGAFACRVRSGGAVTCTAGGGAVTAAGDAVGGVR